MVDIWWDDSEDGKRADLYAGCLGITLATITKANKWWGGVVWLPGVDLAKEYAPKEAMMADIEAKVSHWFGLANTSRPAMDRTGEG